MVSAAEQLAANLNFGALAKAEELKKRIWFTLGALLVYRLGTYIPLPGIDPDAWDTIFNQQAGGIVGMARTARNAGFTKVIGFDMGGTSTDVSHYAGSFEREYETQVAGVRMRAPMLSIHTVAAGGGSVLHFDGSRYRVGPDSAGADPGPACYGRGCPLTVTDANVLLGRIQPDYFPHVFGEHSDAPLDAGITEAKFSELSEQITAATGDPRGPDQVAAGFMPPPGSGEQPWSPAWINTFGCWIQQGCPQ